MDRPDRRKVHLSLKPLVAGIDPVTVFMGDAGSLCLGFVLDIMAIAISQGYDAGFAPAVLMLALAVLVTDSLTVISRRMIGGRSLFTADRYHFYHI